ncbi:hypothetical protein [Actinopolymorpha pittospori]|uniref:Uncharacterized protein n=1 Tax=Actinopolymorpha pittospori TaxID=648752 RepID=A0A927MZ53_9ACTN|nr:hypothetical protein [Actinopolymorpha pittospori]MBE1609234.1 hypothetical protein [Actinopolymorpha pittospori]
MIPRIVVEDVGADAVLVEVNGEPVLVLSPHQSFASAVGAVERYVPEIDQDRARALVRAHLPDAPDLEVAGDTPSVPAADREERRWVPAKLVIVVAAVAAAGGIVLGQLGNNQAGPTTAQTELRSASSPFASDTFRRLAAEGDLMCTPIGTLRARCTDWDGSVMLAEANVGPEKLTVIFSYGRERIGVAVFPSGAAAHAWVSEPATRAMYPSAGTEGRFVIWGTDQEKVASYLARISGVTDSSLQGPVSSRLGGPTLPPVRMRAVPASLEGMLMGALGVTPEQVDRAISAGLDRTFSSVQASAVALLLGMPPAGESGRERSTTPTSTPTAEPEGSKQTGSHAGSSIPPGHGPQNPGPPGHLPGSDGSPTADPSGSPRLHTPNPHAQQSKKPKQEKRSPTPRQTTPATPATTNGPARTPGHGAGSPSPE